MGLTQTASWYCDKNELKETIDHLVESGVLKRTDIISECDRCLTSSGSDDPNQISSITTYKENFKIGIRYRQFANKRNKKDLEVTNNIFKCIEKAIDDYCKK